MSQGETLHTMKIDYLRLLEAAHQLKGWDSAAEVARGLSASGMSMSEQILTNWKTRGISAQGLLDACAIIGARCEFVRKGELPIADQKRIESFDSITTRAAEIISSLDHDEKLKILNYLQVLQEQRSHAK